MSVPRIAAYGSWRSPITSELIAAGGVGIGQVALDGPDVCWSEARPMEGGRVTVVRCASDGTRRDLVAPPYNVRTRVHEYGGGAYAVVDGVLFFANFADQRLYRLDADADAAPRALTPESASALRYADFAADRARKRLVCVREDHTDAARGVANSIVALAMDGTDAAGRVLVQGHDFYAAPRLDPAGTRLAWLAWNHPNMPWDGCELWVADITASGDLTHARRIAGGEDEALYQPAWSPDGVLHVVSDRSGWWNLYRWNETRAELIPLAPRAAEFGLPQWVFGTSTYGFAGPQRIVCTSRGR